MGRVPGTQCLSEIFYKAEAVLYVSQLIGFHEGNIL